MHTYSLHKEFGFPVMTGSFTYANFIAGLLPGAITMLMQLLVAGWKWVPHEYQ